MREVKKIYASLLLKLGIAFGLFTLFRILFIAFNAAYLDHITFQNFWGGMRFDWMAISILYLPFIVAHLIDFRGQSKMLAWLFHISNTAAILVSVLDFEYFKFTFKRTTSDLFVTKGLAQDIANLSATFISDFWYLLLLAGLFIWLSTKAYDKTRRIEIKWPGWIPYLAFFIPVFAFSAIGTRGGIQLKPLGVINAGKYANAQNIPVVLNTPFTLIKSAFKKGEQETPFFDETELAQHFSPLQSYGIRDTTKTQNVVLIILEGFSKEYIGAFNSPGYTPFLDSLINQSLVFENAFANGKKSIEALPAILSGIPSLMSTPYISSKYGSNKIQSIGSVLSDHGYNTSFYHGGENGTMGFNAFTQIAGIENYYGRNEYPNDGDYDGSWGIFDIPYLSYAVDEISEKEEPFFSGIFTLSSHHPYTVPAPYDSEFEEGPIPILKSVRYADEALRQFFRKAEKEPWFKNTLFVLTADHTAQGMDPAYKSRIGMYRVPLVFYAPNQILPKQDPRLVQQVDIFPSVIDWLGLKAEIISYGKSVFREDTVAYNVNFISNVYQIIGPQYCLLFDGEQATGLYQRDADPTLKNNLLGTGLTEEKVLEQKIKSILQDYKQRLIRNEMYVQETK